MREIEIYNGLRQVRGLTVSEIEYMAGKGWPISRWGVNIDALGADDSVNEMFDHILTTGTMCGSDFDFKHLTPADERALFFGILAETYGSRDEEKNLSGSGNTTQTPTE